MITTINTSSLYEAILEYTKISPPFYVLSNTEKRIFSWFVSEYIQLSKSIEEFDILNTYIFSDVSRGRCMEALNIPSRNALLVYIHRLKQCGFFKNISVRGKNKVVALTKEYIPVIENNKIKLDFEICLP